MKILGSSLVLAVVAILSFLIMNDPWEKYYKKTQGRDPRQILVDALETYPIQSASNSNALDVGAGAGNETKYLIGQGWNVFSLDSAPSAEKYIRAQIQEADLPRLHFIGEGLEELNWDDFPAFQLIFANASLPCSRFPPKQDAGQNQHVSY